MTESQPPFRKVLIANRGEIAVRISRTLREMGIASVAVFSDADRDAAHVRAADESLHIGGSLPQQSYLNQDRIIEIAQATGAEAIHPGYGFLSENAGFAGRCVDAGVVFVGPPPAAIATMGSKIEARRAANAAGVPIVPGTEDPLADADEVATVAAALGYPVALKAAAGGGGYGMRVVTSAADIQGALDGVRRDAERAFGDSTVYVEKYLSPAPRHVEIQVFGDRHGNVVHLGERECSLQRRYQKLVEESPSPGIEEATRARMGSAAVSLARQIGYHSAGTVEFLVTAGGEFFFLEMNTRLQVEHPVTEEVAGVDLVREMIRVAAGERLGLPATHSPRGHAIEARVYAEDPARGFLPSPGEVVEVVWPSGPNLRVDSAIEPGSKITVYYDPLIAKVIAWGDDREQAIATLRDALAAFRIEGVETNLAFLRQLVATPDFAAGDFHTRYIEESSGVEESRSRAVEEMTIGNHSTRHPERREGSRSP